MIRIVLSLFLAVDLAGCTSISHPFPKCDGYSRRPLNRSMWQEDKSAAKTPTSNAAPVNNPAASYVEEPATATLTAFAHFDAVSSYRPCGER